MKSENYSLLGGINTKVSQYNNSPLEFLNITNLDFQTVGALSQRWGSTQYIGQTFPGRINSLYEYSKLSGASYIVTSHSGGIWYGATTGQYQGVSLSNLNSTFVPPYAATFNYLLYYIYSYTTGVSVSSYDLFYQGISTQVVSTIKTVYASQVMSENKTSSVVFQNYMFMADGAKFLKFDGITTTAVGLPPVLLSNTGTVSPISFAAYVTTGAAASLPGFVPDGTYAFNLYASYLNNRGFEGQIWPIASMNASATNSAGVGGSFITVNATFIIPPQFGITAIKVYSYAQNGYIQPGGNWNSPYVYMNSYPVNGSTLLGINLGYYVSGYTSAISNAGALADPNVNNYYSLGFTLNMAVGSIYMTDYYPKYLEVFQNRLFCAGFSSTPSTVWFSDTGEPEGFPLENNFEVRTNDADVITAMKSYNSRLYIFKKNSFHVLLGDTTSNFNLQEQAVIYGCLNNRCVETYDNYMVFLDRKGLMLFNASNISCLSNKVQSFFDRMNYNAALTEACVVHDKLRNQILVAIPIDGSSVNNITMVYDYLAGAWTTYNGYSVSVFTTIQGYNNTKNVFYGSHSGTINWFGPSFLSDNGTGFTSYFKTRFLHDMGESIEKQFRRLYLNADTGTTFTMPLNFYQDYGLSTTYQTTFVLSEFQKRIDFGIPAKSLAFELFNLNTNSPLRLYGFTIESRMQRRV